MKSHQNTNTVDIFSLILTHINIIQSIEILLFEIITIDNRKRGILKYD